MALAPAHKEKVIKDFGRKEGDTGSPEVQIALLTERIKGLSAHIRENKQDVHSRRGLIAMVARRNKLLKYLARTNRDSYLETIKRLGLRK